MKKENKHIIFSLFILLAGISFACNKISDYNEPFVADQTKPNPPANISVINFEGGASIIYDLPQSKNILYVLADYVINDSTGAARQTKTSYYTDTIVVEGFAEAKEYKVTLRTVSRANVESDPVTVTVNPDPPAYLTVAQNINMLPTFGGVNAKTENPSGQGITIVYLYKDPSFGNEYVIRDQRYFDALEIDYAIRGFDTLKKDFGIYVMDRWGNKSPVKYASINPIFEKLLDKTKFSVYSLPMDIPTQGSFPVPRMWDNITTNFWHVSYSPTPDLKEYPKPMKISFGIGELTKLSRFVFYQRSKWDPGYWGVATVEKFSVWGSSKDIPLDTQLPLFAPVGTVVGDWENIGNFDFPLPPSGNPPGSQTAADKAWWDGGANFTFPEGVPNVKYLRIAISKTWGNADPLAYIGELDLYGGK